MDAVGRGEEVGLGPPVALPSPFPIVPVSLLRTALGSANCFAVRVMRSLNQTKNYMKSLTKAKCDPTTGLAVNAKVVPFVVSYQSPKGWLFEPLEEYLWTDVIRRSRMVVELIVAAVHISQPRIRDEKGAAE